MSIFAVANGEDAHARPIKRVCWHSLNRIFVPRFGSQTIADIRIITNNIKDITTNDSLRLAELLKTPICKMDGEELAFLITSITTGTQSQLPINQPKTEEHIVYGIAGTGGFYLFEFYDTTVFTLLSGLSLLALYHAGLYSRGIIEDNTIASQKEIIERYKKQAYFMDKYTRILEGYIDESDKRSHEEKNEQ